MSKLIDSIPERLLAARKLVLGIVFLVTLGFAAQLPAVKIYTDFEGLLPQNHPFIQVHNEIRGVFGGANVMSVAVEVKDGTIFTRETLATIFRVTQSVDSLPGVNHNLVSSLTHRATRRITLTEEGSVRSEVYYDSNKELTDAEIEELKAKVSADPRVYGLLVSPDLKAALIKAQFVDGMLDYQGIYDGLQRLRQEESRPGLEIHATGQPVLVGWVYHYLPQSLQVFLFTAVIIVLLLIVYFRRFYGVLIPLVAISLSSIWGLGCLALLDYHLDPLMLVIPFLIAARAMSHGIQLVVRWYQELHVRKNSYDAAKATLTEMLHPGALGVTCDAIGLLLITIGSIPINFELGIFTALWAILGILNVLITIPLLLSFLPTPKTVARKEHVMSGLLPKIGRLVAARQSARALVVAGVAVMAISMWLGLSVTIGESEPGSPLLYRDHDYNRSSTAINNLFPGSEELLLVAKAEKGGIKEPAVLRTIEDFGNYMLLDPSLGGVKALPGLVRQVNKLIHNGDERYAQIPPDASLVGGLLFAYMASSPIPGILNDFVDSDASVANLAFFYKDHKADTISNAIARAEEGARQVEAANAGVSIHLAGGILGVSAAINQEVVHGNLIIIPAVFICICGLVAFSFRSWHAGLLMFVAMLFPTALTYAYLAVNDMGLNINTVPLVAVGLGIGIDYAVYIIDRIRDELHEHLDLEHAISRAISTTGLAVTFTFTTLVGGIVMWVFLSDLRFQADAAKLLIFMIAISAIAAMLFVPAWIALFRPKFIVREVDPASERVAVPA